MKNKTVNALLYSILFCILTLSPAMAMDYRVSKDFDLIEGASGAKHTVRIISLSSGATNVTIEGLRAGSPSTMNGKIDGLSGKDFDIRSGDRLKADQPVIAIKYPIDYNWSLQPVPSADGKAYNWTGGGHLLIGAVSDGTEISLVNGKGEEQKETLNSSHAVFYYAGQDSVTITSNMPIQVYSADLDDYFFDKSYLLLPNSDNYVPLRALMPNTAGDKDRVSSLKNGVHEIIFGKLVAFIGDAIDFVLGGSPAYAAATSETLVNNNDGTYTFTQKINTYSTAPHYTGPWRYGSYSTYWVGFGNYNWYNQDWGWQHSFPYFNQPNLQILSSTLTIRAYDVDSEPWHGYGGEYDGISGDGNWLNPQYLQGTNGTWSVTNFDVDTGALYDGALNVWMDIDMHHNVEYWATTLDYTLLTVKFTYTSNNPPYAPTLSISPVGCTYDNNDLVVTVTGPTPADPDGDPVTYQYRWLVDPGTGNFIDDEFAGRNNHTGNKVPASDTRNNDRWRVEVTPVDSHNAKGTKGTVTFATIGQCNTPPIADAGKDQKVCSGALSLSGAGSYDPDGTIKSYLWQLYSGGLWVNIGTSRDIIYNFAAKGTYQVRLTVTDNYNATDDAIVFITVDGTTCGFSSVRAIDTTSAQDVSFDLSSATKVPYSVTNGGDKTVVEWRFDSFKIDQAETISFDLDLSNLVQGENRLVDHKLELIYLDRNGSEVKYELPALYVRVLESAVKGAITIDKSAYQAYEDALISASITSLSRFAKTLDAKILVEDAQGTVVKEVAALAGLNFAAGETKNLGNLIFNTGTTYAGDYRAHLFIYENGKQAGEASAAFTILPTKAVTSKVATDKAAYSAHEQVAITSTVKSESPNYIYRNLTAKVSLLNSQGQILFTDSKPLSMLTQGQITEFKRYWNTAVNPRGAYTVTLEVFEDMSVISSSQTAFDILGSSGTGAGLAGTIAAQPNPVYRGQNETLGYTITNNGNEDISNLNIKILVVDPDTNEIKMTFEGAVNLPMNTMMPGSFIASTSDMLSKTYLAVLQVSSAALTQPKTLASTTFEVKAGLELLKGIIEAKPNPIYQGDEETLTYSVTNSGSEDFSDLGIKVLVVDPDTEEVKQTFETSAGINVNATITGAFVAQTLNLQAKTYIVKLQATSARTGQTKVLAGTLFEVKLLEVSKVIPDAGRVLVWLNYAWESGQNCPDRKLIEQALKDTGVSYYIVLDKKDFDSELRNPWYTDIMILGTRNPIEDHISEELREQVNSGAGLIASMFYRQNLDEKVFGINYINSLPGTGYPVVLAAGELWGAGAFQSYGRALDVEALNSAEVMGWIEETNNKGTFRHPGIVSHTYGLGKALYYAFDFGMSAGDYSQFASMLNASLRHIHRPERTDSFRPAKMVPVEITVKSHGGAFDVRITENYPAEIKLYDPAKGQWVTSNPWISDIHVGPSETVTILYYALTPDIAGTYKLQTVIEYTESGTYRYYQDLYADIVVGKNTAAINGDVIAALRALPVTDQDAVKVGNAIKSLQDVMSRPVATRIDIEQNIHDILAAIDSLLTVTGVNVSDVILMTDGLLETWESSWYFY